MDKIRNITGNVLCFIGVLLVFIIHIGIHILAAPFYLVAACIGLLTWEK